MNYLDIETIQLFLYLLYYTPERNHKEFHNLLDIEQFPEKLKAFKEKVKDDIFTNKIEDAFFIAKSHPLLTDDIFTKKIEEALKIIKHDAKLGDNFWIVLENSDKLMTFLEEYTNRFRNDELAGNPNAFSYKNQLQYFQKEFEYLFKHYGDRFFITPVFREEGNSKESMACGLRIFDFIMFLHFHQNFYVLIRDCKRIQSSDNYLYLKDKFFNIALEIELAKPVKQIFDELSDELKKEQAVTETKSITIAGYTITPIEEKGWYKGKFRLIHKNSCIEGLINSLQRAKILEHILSKKGVNVSTKEIFDKFTFKNKMEPIKALERYINELNTAIRTTLQTKGRKKYLEIIDGIIINNIP